MRLWSIHPFYLDAAGLVALWREGLLAQKVLRGETRGYVHHPQLVRFRNVNHVIGNYLLEVYAEAERRGYHFDKNKILECAPGEIRIPVQHGQLEYEFNHLMKKLTVRSLKSVVDKPSLIIPHPIFYEVEGGVSGWEILPDLHLGAD